MKLAFTLSTINPYTEKHLREWTKEGINGFIAECYTPKTAIANRFMADHYIAWCETCKKQHSLFGFGTKPIDAYNDCKKQLDNFKCGDIDNRTADCLL